MSKFVATDRHGTHHSGLYPQALERVAMVALLSTALIGCAPVTVVGGTTYGVGLGVDRAMYCMTNRCEAPPPQEVLAAMDNDVARLGALLAENPSIARDPRVLRGAIIRGADDAVRFLVPRYTEPNTPHAFNEEGNFSLALSWGQCSTAELLLSLGVREYGHTPIRHIASAGTIRPTQASACYDLAQRLIAVSSGVTSSEKDEALWWASIYSTPMVSLLLSIGANPGYVGRDGNTPMHMAARGPGPAYSRERRVDSSEVISLLAKSGESNFDRRNNRGDTPLHLAIESGNVAAAKLLITKGADPNIKNAMGKTPATTAKDKNIDLSAP